MDENRTFWYNKTNKKGKTRRMRRPFPKVDFPLLHLDTPLPQRGRQKRLAVLPYREVMDYLQRNYALPNTNKERASSIELMGHKVTINSLKLRTFAHFDQQNQVCCANPECQTKPQYFVLETPQANKRQHYSVAYLSLYGTDSEGNAVEFTHDHTLARCFGGANTLANTTMMCFPCNNRKSRIESRMHHRTLRILKEYLEDTTGEAANPQFLLERVRNSDFNFPENDREFERAGVVDLNEALEAIRDPKRQAHTWHGRKVKTTGVRLDAFSTHATPCCQDPECGLPATHFAVERVADKRFYEHHGYHLNMYGRKSDGREVQFMHHHMLRPGHDGVPEAFAIVTLCRDCKDASLTKDHSQMAHLITSLGGVSRKEVEAMDRPRNAWVIRNELEKTEISRKTQKIIETAESLAGIFNCAVEDFIALCNRKGQDEQISNIMNAKHNGVRRVVKTLPGMTPAGARWFRKEQRAVFGREDEHNERALTAKEIANTQINIARVRKINRCVDALATYGVDAHAYLQHCQHLATQNGVDNKLTSAMNSLRQTVAVLEVSPGAARVFTAECGRILHVGPDRPDGIASTPTVEVMNRALALRTEAGAFSSKKTKKARHQWQVVKKTLNMTDEQLRQWCQHTAVEKKLSNDNSDPTNTLAAACAHLNLPPAQARAYLLQYALLAQNQFLITKYNQVSPEREKQHRVAAL